MSVPVIVLCGGQGTRLREETEYRPKPLVEVGGRPILWHILKLFAHQGLKEFVLCLGYQGHMIKDYFLNYEAMNNDFRITLGEKRELDIYGQHDEQDYQITLSDTGLQTMTGGRVKRVARYITSDTFMVTYGDGVSDINLSDLINFHIAHGRIATVTTVHPISRYGVVKVNDDDTVTGFVEKPQLEDRVSAGFFVFNRAVFDYLTDDDCVLEREPLEKLARDGQLAAYHHDGFFYAMDTYREYLYLNDLWNSGKAPWKTW